MSAYLEEALAGLNQRKYAVPNLLLTYPRSSAKSAVKNPDSDPPAETSSSFSIHAWFVHGYEDD
jgi:hypothetical protein